MQVWSLVLTLTCHQSVVVELSLRGHGRPRARASFRSALRPWLFLQVLGREERFRFPFSLFEDGMQVGDGWADLDRSPVTQALEMYVGYRTGTVSACRNSGCVGLASPVLAQAPKFDPYCFQLVWQITALAVVASTIISPRTHNCNGDCRTPLLRPGQTWSEILHNPNSGESQERLGMLGIRLGMPTLPILTLVCARVVTARQENMEKDGGGRAVASVLQSHVGFGLIKESFHDGSFAQQHFVQQWHQVVLHVAANAGDQVEPPLPEALQQRLGKITLISEDLPL